MGVNPIATVETFYDDYDFINFPLYSNQKPHLLYKDKYTQSDLAPFDVRYTNVQNNTDISTKGLKTGQVVREVDATDMTITGQSVLTATHKINTQREIVLSVNSYDELGRLKTKTLNGGGETIEYSYNLRNWLKSITSPHFSQTQYYQDAPDGKPSCYNGNISALKWGQGSLQDEKYYFTYDGLNRMKKAQYAPNELFSEEITNYDKNGNILGIKRNGYLHDFEAEWPVYPGPIDDIGFEYNGNQLKNAWEMLNDQEYTVVATNDFREVYDENISSRYLYDANGNQYADFNKGIAWIQFNSLNLPRKIQFSNGNKAEYFYDATGVKYKAQWGYAATPQNIPLGATGTEYQSPTGGMRTEYCGNYVYENGILRKIITPEGYVVTNSNNNLSEAIIKIAWWHCYFLKDHLGNTRRTLRGSQMRTGETTLYIYSDIIDYYPFGLEITRVSNPEGEDYSPSYLAGATIPYLYNGKEIDRMHGLNWYDYGARYYDGATGRWHGVDPLAEAMPYASSFNYCLNNPVNHIDPDGKIPVWPLFGAAVDYGFQVKDNYSIGKTGYDAWVGDVNFVSVGLSSLNPSGKFKVLKVLAVEVIKAATEYTTLNEGVQLNNNLKDVATKATVNTLIDVGAGKLTDAGSKKAVQNANSEVSAANQKLKTAERQANRSPNSTKKSENVNKSQSNVQLTRNKQVRTQVLNSTVGKAPEATQQIINTSTDRINENDKRK